MVHGGAGKWKDERIPVGMKHVEIAAKCGFEVLEKGGSALDAAEVCTMYMESCGELNAGRGGRWNKDGYHELDAMIIDGEKLQFGSVAAVAGVENPISLARYIMEKTDYNFFAGQNARVLFERMLAEGYREKRYKRSLDPPVHVDSYDIETADTVGCVVVDTKGRIACTSSTGGIPKKTPGRVGDSPVFGAGAYANEVCGASATGYGEHIMRVVMSRTAVLYVEQGSDVQEAADESMKMFEEKTGSEAGIIMVDTEGNHGRATNAKAMPVTIIQGDIEHLVTEMK